MKKNTKNNHIFKKNQLQNCHHIMPRSVPQAIDSINYNALFYTVLAVFGILVVAGPIISMPSFRYWGFIVPILSSILMLVYIIYLLFARQAEEMASRNHIILLVIFACFIYIPLANRFISVIGDNVVFIGSAVGLSKGMGYVHAFASPPIRPTHFVFGFPALLVPTVTLFKDNIIALKVTVAVFGVIGAAAVFLLFKTYLTKTFAFIICLVTIVNLHIISNVSQVISEAPFIAFSFLSLWAVMAYAKNTKNFSLYCFLAIFLLGYSYFIKPVSLVLVMAAILYLGLMKQWKKIIYILLGFIIMVLPWLINKSLYNKKHASHQTGSYITQMFTLYKGDVAGSETTGRSVWDNFKLSFSKGFKRQLQHGTEIIFAKSDGGRNMLALIIVLFGFVYHVYQCFLSKMDELLPDIYFSGIFMVNLLVGSFIASRYVSILAPLFIFYFLFGTKTIIGYVFSKSDINNKDIVAKAVFLVITLFIFFPHLANAMQSIQYFRRQQGYGGAWGRYYEAAQWIAQNTTSTKPIVSRKAELLYPWIKRYGVNYPITANQDSMLTFLLDHNYILIDNGLGFNHTQQYVIPVINQHLDKFKIVYRTQQPYQYVVEIIKKE